MQLFVRVGGACKVTVVVPEAALVLAWLGAAKGGLRVGGHGGVGGGWGPVGYT